MDKGEAGRILRKHLELYRKRSYRQLLRLMEKEEYFEIRTESGTVYRLEFQAFWDDRKKENLRVIGSIGDGGLRSIFPVCDDFIVSPDGSFAGE